MSQVPVNGVVYSIDIGNNQAIVIGSDSSTTTIQILDKVTYNTIDYPVTSIANNAFQGNGLVSLTFVGNSVTTIGAEAFKDCGSLTSVTNLPDNVVLGNNVFQSCPLTSITIPSGVTDIPNFAFWNCRQLSSITFVGNSVTRIGNYAFEGCSFSSFSIPNSVITIENNAFINCRSLTSITIGTNVTSIGGEVFRHCTSLTSITIPSSVTSIGNFSFQGCSNLTSVNLPNNVSIGNFAFADCNFTSITIPTGVTTINEGTFSGCFSLSSVTFVGNSLTTIGNYAFYYCTALTSITIPSGVTTIGPNTFNNCSALSSVTFVGNTLTTIGNNAFSPSGLTSITFPSSVTSIGSQAFKDCGSLTSVTNLPDNVVLGNNVFQSCPLTSITIPSGVTDIPNFAFWNCRQLSSITFVGNSVTRIGNYAFEGCSFSSFSIPNSVITIENNAFINCRSLTSITIGTNVTSIGGEVFRHCTSLTSITIPNSVTTIGNEAFSGCSSLLNVYFMNLTNLPTLDSSSFDTPNDRAYYQPGVLDPNSENPATYLTSNGFTYADPIPQPPLVCFKKDTKILTNKGYVNVQDLRKGDLIKTLLNDYKPIHMIGFKEMTQTLTQIRIKDQLYKCTKEQYPEIIEDLIITGCHSILVDSITDKQRNEIQNLLGDIYVTDRKYRLPTCLDERSSIYDKPGNHTIYHFALENDNYYMNYGVYANGLLVETCTQRYLKELSNMTLI